MNQYEERRLNDLIRAAERAVRFLRPHTPEGKEVLANLEFEAKECCDMIGRKFTGKKNKNAYSGCN